ncbi:MAG: hypothetical protein JJE44_12310 [Flavobacteriaceae bacterium]|nr:hypothetical protein [Flavobacteriaceae bacterium]
MKKFAIISLVAGFGILTGLNLSDLIDSSFVFEGNYKTLIKIIIYFSMMSVMFYEWIKILKQEKKNS